MIKVKTQIKGVLFVLIGIVLHIYETSVAKFILYIAESIINIVNPNVPQTQNIFSNILLSFELAKFGVLIFEVLFLIYGLYLIRKGFEDRE